MAESQTDKLFLWAERLVAAYLVFLCVILVVSVVALIEKRPKPIDHTSEPQYLCAPICRP